MRAAIVLACAGALSAAGCTVSSSDVVKQLPTDLAEHAYVSDIVVRSVPSNVSSEFRQTLISALRAHSQQCARGTQPLRLEVVIALFSPQNPAVTILVGDSNKIKGSARLFDPATDAVVGDMDIARSTGWGGIIAAAAMADAESKMADGFADEVCQRAFVRAR